MGSNFAIDLAENIDISLEQAIGYHLQGNHYPPVPLSMVPVCIQAIDFAHQEMWDETIEMPDGISYNRIGVRINDCYNDCYGINSR